MGDHMMPEMTLEMIDAFFSPLDHKMPDIPMMKASTPGLSGMDGYTFDLKTQKAVYTAHAKPDQYVPPYKRFTPEAPQNKEYAVSVKQQDDEAFKKYSRDGPGGGGSTRAGSSIAGLSSRLDTMTMSSGSARGAAGSERGSAIGPKSGQVFQKNRNPEEFYASSFFKNKPRYSAKLPIVARREEIVNTIEGNSVVLIKGSTGSGKTTQVPQFILDDATEKRRPCNIIVTQPRKIAAKSIATRVCDERDWEMGSICGYQVGMDRKASDDTCILYCTSGVLLQKIVNDKSLNEFTHIVLDEIHERGSDLDFCLLVVKKLQRTVSGQVKIVLMSATMDVKIFSDYFTQYMAGDLHPCPVLNIEGRMFDVSCYYLNQLEPLADRKLDYPDFGEPKLDPECVRIAVRLIGKFEEMERKEESTRRYNRDIILKHGAKESESDSCFDTSQSSVSEDESNFFRGTVLVFLPGLAEINSFWNMLNDESELELFEVIQLHSAISLPPEKYNRIFRPPPAGKRKVILSTNIAESSITVPDVRYVIDFCLTKNLFCDPETSYPSLRLEWASKSSSDQRKGRAGRVANGRSYRMVPQPFYKELDAHAPPEMQRAPLNQLVLKTKVLSMGEPKQILGLALSPPNLDDIERTILCLKEVGALVNVPTKHEEQPAINPRFDGDMTFVGQVMAAMPLDVHLTKLILLGHTFGILDDAIQMAASLSIGGFFAKPWRKDVNTFMALLSWAAESNSDIIATLNALTTARDKGILNREPEREILNRERERERRKGKAKWCENNHVVYKRLLETQELADELTSRLERFNIGTTCSRDVLAKDIQPAEFEGRMEMLRKVVIAGAFYPNYFVRMAKDERSALKELSGLDPFRTVLLSGVPSDQGPLYKDQISAVFGQFFDDNKCESKYHYEGTKVFVEFIPPAGLFTRTKIPAQVYLALKMAKVGVAFEFDGISKEEAALRMERFKTDQDKFVQDHKCLRSNRMMSSREDANETGGHTKSEGGRFRDFPSVLTEKMSVIVTAVISLDHYYVILDDDTTFQDVSDVHKSLNNPCLPPLRLTPREVQNLKIGDLAAAKIIFPVVEAKPTYQRARVTEIIKKRREEHIETIVRLFFVDCGLSEEHNIEDLRKLEINVVVQYDFQAFEVRLAKIRPSIRKYPKGQWSDETIKSFRPNVMGHQVEIVIFSIVDNVIRVSEMADLTIAKTPKPGREPKPVSIVKELLKHDLAEETEEIMASKLKHEERKMLRDSRVNALVPFAEEVSKEEEQDKEKDKKNGEKDENEKVRKGLFGDKERIIPHDNDWQIYTPDVNPVGRRPFNMIGPQGPPPQQRGPRRNFQRVRLHGPMNPLVLAFNPLNSSSTFKACSVAQESVNSICLDDHPGNVHDRLLVAATVGMHASGNRVSPRDTTLMPMVPGLAHILPILFAPQVEFRTNSKQTHLTGALLGLGFNREVNCRNIQIEEGPIFPDHDMELTFDTEITLKSLMPVNHLRDIISRMLNSQETQRLTRTNEDTTKMQITAQNCLFKILDEKRKSLRLTEEELNENSRLRKDRMFDYRRPYKWNEVDASLQCSPFDGPPGSYTKGSILPLLNCVWTQLDQLSGTASSRGTDEPGTETETVTSMSDVDTESVTSSNLEGAVAYEEERAPSPRQDHMLETGSQSGYSVHSSEYASDWKSDRSRTSGKEDTKNRRRQLLELRDHEAELRRRSWENDDEKYPCKLCGVHLPNLSAIKNHLEDDDHHNRKLNLVKCLDRMGPGDE